MTRKIDILSLLRRSIQSPLGAHSSNFTNSLLQSFAEACKSRTKMNVSSAKGLGHKKILSLEQPWHLLETIQTLLHLIQLFDIDWQKSRLLLWAFFKYFFTLNFSYQTLKPYFSKNFWNIVSIFTSQSLSNDSQMPWVKIKGWLMQEFPGLYTVWFWDIKLFSMKK